MLDNLITYLGFELVALIVVIIVLWVLIGIAVQNNRAKKLIQRIDRLYLVLETQKEDEKSNASQLSSTISDSMLLYADSVKAIAEIASKLSLDIGSYINDNHSLLEENQKYLSGLIATFANLFGEELQVKLRDASKQINDIVDNKGADWLFMVTERRFSDIMTVISRSAQTVTDATDVMQYAVERLGKIHQVYDSFIKTAENVSLELKSAASELNVSFAPTNDVLSEMKELIVQSKTNFNYLFSEVATAIKTTLEQQSELNLAQRELFLNGIIQSVSMHQGAETTDLG